MEIITVLRQLLEMGWPGIVLIMLWVMWKQYIDTARTNKDAYERLLSQYLEDMRLVAGLRREKLPAD